MSQSSLHKSLTYIMAFGVTLFVLTFAPFLPQRTAFALGEATSNPIITLDFKDTDIRDVLRAISAQTGINIVAERDVEGEITLHLTDIPFDQGLKVLTDSANLAYQKDENIFRVFKPTTSPFTIQLNPVTGNITLSAKNADLGQLIERLTQVTGTTIMLRSGTKATINAEISDLPLDKTLAALADIHGMAVQMKDNYYLIQDASAALQSGISTLTLTDGLLTVRANNVDIRTFTDALVEKLNKNIVLENGVRGQVSVNLREIPMMTGIRSIYQSNGFEVDEQSELIYIRMAAPGTGNVSIKQLSDGRFDLDVKSADLTKVIEELSKQAGFNFVIYNSVRSQINHVKVANVTVEEAFTYLLKGGTLTYRKNGNIFLIGDITGNHPDAQDFTELKVINLKYLVAETVPNLFPAWLSPTGIKVLRERNALLVSGTAEYINSIDTFVKTIDKGDNMIISTLIPLTFTSLEDVLPIVTKAFPTLAIQPISSENSVVINGTQEIVDNVVKLIQSLDKPSMVATEIIALKHLRATEIPKLLPENLTKASIHVIPEQNAIAFTGTKDQNTKLKDYIITIDTANPQILFDVLVVEYTDSDTAKQGIKAALNSGGASAEFSPLESGPLAVSLNSTVRLSPSFSATLNVLLQQGKAQVLANPKIATLNGHPAEFSVLSKSRYWDPRFEDSDGSESEDDDPPSTDGLHEGVIRSIETGIVVKLEPWVSGDKEITIAIEPSISDSAGMGPGGLPQTNERSVKTNVRIKDGETIIIGGLIQNSDRENISKVPILGDLPILGLLFRSRETTLQQSEFVIYITPYLVENAEELREYYNAPSILVQAGE